MRPSDRLCTRRCHVFHTDGGSLSQDARGSIPCWGGDRLASMTPASQSFARSLPDRTSTSAGKLRDLEHAGGWTRHPARPWPDSKVPGLQKQGDLTISKMPFRVVCGMFTQPRVRMCACVCTRATMSRSRRPVFLSSVYYRDLETDTPW